MQNRVKNRVENRVTHPFFHPILQQNPLSIIARGTPTMSRRVIVLAVVALLWTIPVRGAESGVCYDCLCRIKELGFYVDLPEGYDCTPPPPPSPPSPPPSPSPPEFCSDDPSFTGVAVRQNGIVQYCEDGWTLTKKFKENSELFYFDDPYWETDETLLPAGEDSLPSPNASADAQYPTYGSTPFSKIRVKSSAGEITIDLGILHMSFMSLAEIFTGDQVLLPWLTMDEWNNVFPNTGQTLCDPAQNMGLNSRCQDNARTRIGFCGNVPEQACQNSNTDDADYAFGLGVYNQEHCKAGAGWTCGYDAYWGVSKSHDATLWVSAGRPMNTWCAANEYWDGSACQTCPVGSFSPGGDATSTSCTTCSTGEYWDGSTCQT